MIVCKTHYLLTNFNEVFSCKWCTGISTFMELDEIEGIFLAWSLFLMRVFISEAYEIMPMCSAQQKVILRLWAARYLNKLIMILTSFLPFRLID